MSHPSFNAQGSWDPPLFLLNVDAKHREQPQLLYKVLVFSTVASLRVEASAL